VRHGILCILYFFAAAVVIIMEKFCTPGFWPVWAVFEVAVLTAGFFMLDPLGLF
jgi:hypothetical protein